MQTTSLEEVERTEVGGRGGVRICDVEGSPGLGIALRAGGVGAPLSPGSVMPAWLALSASGEQSAYSPGPHPPKH